MALDYGADAVYLAGEAFGMRAAAGNFTQAALAEAVQLCHSRQVRVYVTCNTLPHDGELGALPAFLEFLDAAGADAVITADLGVFQMAGRYAPHLRRHISTQAGVVNSESARAWYDLGAKRVVLARELSLKEIAQIRANTPGDLELEAFVHGAMCVSFSGRCLLSNYLTGRDANRGACAQPCRWKYHLVEEKRPGEYMEITEDGGTHIFNAKDLCMIQHIPKLMAAGLTSFKIEGRMKSAYYAAVVTNAYRKAIDAALTGQPLALVWRAELDKVSHRPYSTGFYFGPEGAGQHHADSLYVRDWDVVAIVEQCDKMGNARLRQRNRFFTGDKLELLTPQGEPVAFIVDNMKNGAGEPIGSAPHPEMEILMRLPVYAPPRSILRKQVVPAHRENK